MANEKLKRYFDIELNSGNTAPLVVNVNQYDQSEIWIFTTMLDGVVYQPNVASIVGIKSDKKGIINSGKVEDGKVVIYETKQMTASPGDAIYELQLDSEVHGTANFIVRVEKKPGDDAEFSDSDVSLMQEAIEAAQHIDDNVERAEKAAESAEASATNASKSESNAKTYATNANTSATNASTSESNAKKYAESVSESLTQIETNKTDIATNKKSISTLQASVETLDAIADIVHNGSAGSMNSRYENKSLGSDLSSCMTKVKNGDFSDLSVGNYFTINNVNWRIAGADLFMNTGDTQLTKHHLVLISDTNVLTADGSTTKYMNDSDTTAGGYQGSKMWKTTLPNLLSSLPTALTNYIISHRELMSNAYSSGASGGAWVDVKINIPTEMQVYGGSVWGLSNLGGGSGYNIGNAYSRFPLFTLAPQHICNRAVWWLRGAVSSAHFAYVTGHGNANCAGASNAWIGVRPYVLVGA